MALVLWSVVTQLLSQKMKWEERWGLKFVWFYVKKQKGGELWDRMGQLLPILRRVLGYTIPVHHLSEYESR